MTNPLSVPYNDIKNDSIFLYHLFEALSGNNVLVKNDAPKFTILAATPSYLQQTGYSKENMIGKGVFEAFPANNTDPNFTGGKDLLLSYLHVAKHKEAHFLPVQRYDMQKDDGSFSERYWKISNSPVFSPDGEVDFIIHTSEDITDLIVTKKQISSLSQDVTDFVEAKKQLQESEMKYRSLFETMDQGFCILDMVFDENNAPVDYYFVEVNKVFENQTGLKNAVGKSVKQLVPELEQHWFDLYGNVIKTGESIRFIEKSDAMGRWFEVFAFKLGDGGSNKISLLFTDITSRKKNEEAIKQSEQNLRNVILQSPVAMTILRGPEFIVEIANDKMFELWGRPKEELLNKPIFEGLPRAKNKGDEEVLKNVYRTGETFKKYGTPVTLLRNESKETVYVNYVYEAFREADGTISGVMVAATDVTEQVIAGKKIELSEAALKQFKFMSDHAQDPFILIREDGTFAYLNRKALEAWGYTEEEASTLRVPDVDPIYNDELFSAAFARAQKEIVPQFETLHKRKDGHIYSVEVNMGGLTIENKPYLFAVARDITERKKTDAAIKNQNAFITTIANSATSTLFMMDKNGYCTFLNKTGEAMFGYTLEELMEKPMHDIIHHHKADGSFYPREECSLENSIRENKPVPPHTELFFRKDGSSFPASCSASPVFENGVPVSAVIEIRDITEQVMMEQAIRENEVLLQRKVEERTIELKNLNEELKRSNVNLEEFAYAASHDLKEPIRKIHFFSERIKDVMSERMTTEEKKYFDRLEAASKRMASLIDDLLSYSQISIKPLSHDKVDFNQVVDQVLEDLDLEIEDKKAKITVDELFTIKGHHRQLQQALQNLIGNAIKYNKLDVSPEILITSRKIIGKDTRLLLHADEKEKLFYCLEIIDNGIGFEQEDAERIFNVFTRLHGMTEYKGTGIGLSIVRKVVENHNGHIWAESEPGKGATFKMLLPAE